MPQPIIYQELYEHERIIQFLEVNELNKNKRYMRNYVSVIGRYLIYRKISLDEYFNLLKTNPEEEITKVLEYRTHLKALGKADQTPYLKRLMRFFGIKFPRYKHPIRKKAIMYFIDDVEDKYMIEFMELQQGLSDGSKRRINRALREFCQFVDLSPSKLYQQIEKGILDVKKLGRMIINFKHTRENPTPELEKKYRWFAISHKFVKLKTFYVNQFFEMVCLVKPIYKSSQLGKSESGIDVSKRIVITKNEVKQLSDRMNINQKCLLFGLFESGLYAKELVKLTYEKIKHVLDLKATLEETKDCVVFFNRRSKSKVGHFAVIGKQTLYYLQQKLAERIRMYSNEEPYQLQDNEYVFSENISPMRKLNASSVNNMIRDKSLSCGIEKITCRDLRRTFISLLSESNRIPIEHRQILYGHTNKLMSAKAYTVSDFVTYEEFYSRSYYECFFLEYDDLKYHSLEEENREIRTALREVSKVLEDIFLAYSDPLGQTKLTKEDLERILKRLRTTKT